MKTDVEVCTLVLLFSFITGIQGWRCWQETQVLHEKTVQDSIECMHLWSWSQNHARLMIRRNHARISKLRHAHSSLFNINVDPAIKADIPRVPSVSYLHADAKAITLCWIRRGRVIEFHGPHAWLKITRHAPPCTSRVVFHQMLWRIHPNSCSAMQILYHLNSFILALGFPMETDAIPSLTHAHIKKEVKNKPVKDGESSGTRPFIT